MEKHIESLLKRSKRGLEDGYDIAKTYRDVLKSPAKRIMMIVLCNEKDDTIDLIISNHLFELGYTITKDISKSLTTGNAENLFTIVMAIMEEMGTSSLFKEKCIESFTQSLIDNDYSLLFFNDKANDFIEIYLDASIDESGVQH